MLGVPGWSSSSSKDLSSADSCCSFSGGTLGDFEVLSKCPSRVLDVGSREEVDERMLSVPWMGPRDAAAGRGVAIVGDAIAAERSTVSANLYL